MKIARIFLKQTNKRIDHAYDYRVPETMADQVVPGVRVAVPFARGGRVVEGFVIAVGDHSKYANKLRDVLQVIDHEPVVDEVHRKLCLWLVKIHDCLFYDALALFIQPVRVIRETDEHGEAIFRPYRKTETVFRLTRVGQSAKTRGKKMARILELLKSGPMSAPELNAAVPNASASRRKLLANEWIEAVDAEALSAPKSAVHLPPIQCDNRVFQSIVENLSSAGDQPVFFYQKDDDMRFKTFLQAAVEKINLGQAVLIIEPEINLLKKNAGRFKSVFGEFGAVYHSGLKITERYRIFHQIQKGHIRIVLGTRTAIFLPFQNIGLIGVDEMGSGQYISDSEPHYQLPDVAAQLAKISGAQMLISDPIPSVTLRWRMAERQIVKAVEPSNFDPVGIIDMKREMQRGNLTIFSHLLEEEIDRALDRGQRAVLLHNRLGYQRAVFCRDCGETVKCPICGRPMKTDHNRTLICMTCGERRPFPKTCPSCGSTHIKGMGVGLDQVVEFVQEKWPDCRVLKIDGAAVRQREFDLVLLDVNLPDGNGFELCRLIKPQHPDTIIIFLTANDQESDQIRGYEVGAVDYITKPFVIRALQRKIKAMFAMLEHHKPAKDIYDDGRLFLDFSEQTASLNGKPLTLSPMEYKMLNLFRKNPRQVLTRGQLLEKLWDIDEKYVDEHTLTTSISRIRSKIESDGGAPYIKTVYGMGYQWTGGEAK